MADEGWDERRERLRLEAELAHRTAELRRARQVARQLSEQAVRWEAEFHRLRDRKVVRLALDAVDRLGQLKRAAKGQHTPKKPQAGDPIAPRPVETTAPEVQPAAPRENSEKTSHPVSSPSFREAAPAAQRERPATPEEEAALRPLLASTLAPPPGDARTGPSISVVIHGPGDPDARARLRHHLEQTAYDALDLPASASAAGTTPDAATALADATGELVLLIHEAIEPVAAGWLARLVATLQRHDAAAVAPRLVHARRPHLATARYPDLTLAPAGYRFTFDDDRLPTPVDPNAGTDPTDPGATVDRPVAALSADCLLIRRAALEPALATPIHAPPGTDAPDAATASPDADAPDTATAPANPQDLHALALHACLDAWGTARPVVLDGGAACWHHGDAPAPPEPPPDYAPRLFREVLRDHLLGAGLWSATAATDDDLDRWRPLLPDTEPQPDAERDPEALRTALIDAVEAWRVTIVPTGDHHPRDLRHQLEAAGYPTRIAEDRTNTSAQDDVLVVLGADPTPELIQAADNAGQLLLHLPAPAPDAIDALVRDLTAELARRPRRIEPVTPPKLPPKDLRFMGESDDRFVEVGDELVADVLEQVVVAPTAAIVDIGSGYGRFAHGLLRQPQFVGRYTGYDILARHIRWCRDEIERKTGGRIRFRHLDVKNARYNPGGTHEVTDVRLDEPDDTVDVVVATSLYTHLPEEDVRHYLAETARILRPDGHAYVTFFVLDDDSRAAAEAGRTAYTLHRAADHVWTTQPDPLHAVAYDERWLLDTCLEVGLIPARPVRRGTWRDGERGGSFFQDLLILTPSADRENSEKTPHAV